MLRTSHILRWHIGRPRSLVRSIGSRNVGRLRTDVRGYLPGLLPLRRFLFGALLEFGIFARALGLAVAVADGFDSFQILLRRTNLGGNVDSMALLTLDRW